MPTAVQSRVQRRRIVLTSDHVISNGEVRPTNGASVYGVTAPRQPAWGATLERVDFGAVTVARAEIREGRGVLEQDGQQGRLLHAAFVESGRVSLISRDGCRLEARDGEVVLYRGTEAYDVEWHDDVSLLVVGVPLELADDFGIPHDAIDGLVPEASALTDPIRSFFDTASGVGDSVSALDAYFLEKIVIELMGALLLSSRGVGHAMRTGEASLHDKALALMTARRADQELTPARIAQDLNVSLRHLQRDFSRNGASVADTLRRLRAEHAVQLLGDPQYDVLSIPEIAHYSGFSSPQLLRRALATFGWGSPADVRRGRV